MGQSILRRLLQMIPVVFLVTVAIFSITLLLPGDITDTILGRMATPEQREKAREKYGLNDPIVVQYVHWVGRVVRGDLGRSYRTHEPVLKMMIRRFPATLELTILSMLIAVFIGVPAGIIAATKRNTFWDVLVTIVSIGGMAVPFFWLAVLFILLFCLVLGWLPATGYVPFMSDPLENLKLMILPSLTVGVATSAIIMRQTRGAMLNVLNQAYIDTARAKGLSENAVNYKHAFSNACIPVITVVGLQVGMLIGGAIVTETIFSIPGVGRMIVEGIFNRDLPVVQGAILIIVISVLLINILVDLLYAIVDPRVKFI